MGNSSCLPGSAVATAEPGGKTTAGPAGRPVVIAIDGCTGCGAYPLIEHFRATLVSSQRRTVIGHDGTQAKEFAHASHHV